MMEAFRLDGKRALVTGASRGIGAAIAKVVAEAGADLGIVGRDREGLEHTKQVVERYGRECLVFEQDLATVEGVRAAGEAALARAPPWDVLVNDAGIAKVASLLEITPEDWDAVLALNLRAVLLLSQRLVPPMIARRSGKIVNVSSIGAFFGTPGLGAYAASKAGLDQLTRTMAVEWGPSNIQVNAVCPMIVLTGMGHQVWDDPARAEQRRAKEARIPLHRFGEPGEVAEAVLFLASPAANFITGVSLPLDGGMQVAP
jgi:2-dehydro-3-deoxy-D-gluconate 5-dehydrogenase